MVIEKKDSQYSPEETAERFERALRKAFLMPPLHQNVSAHRRPKKKIAKAKPHKPTNE
jgi:hypothetical protein